MNVDLVMFCVNDVFMNKYRLSSENINCSSAVFVAKNFSGIEQRGENCCLILYVALKSYVCDYGSCIGMLSFSNFM